jgi:chromosome segregation ATPase
MADADDSLMLTILKELRADMRQHRTLLLQLTDAAHRHDRRFDEVERRFGEVERRISDTRAEIELMLKAELLGQLTHFETRMDERIAQLEDRLSALERPHS